MSLSSHSIDNFQLALLQNCYLSKSEKEKELSSAKTPRDVCVIAKTYFTAQSYGPQLERWVKKYLLLDKKLDSTSGDASINSVGIEIKCSIQDQKGGFNYVQLRPHHTHEFYILLSYSIFMDEAMWHCVPHESMNSLIESYGGYAHGTITQNGKINKDSILANKYEYAIRPNRHLTTGKAATAWVALEPFRVSEDELRQILYKIRNR